MGVRRDDVVAAFLREHGGQDPVEAVRRLCDGLLADVEATIPVRMDVLASYRGAHLRFIQQDEAGCIFHDGAKMIIAVRAQDIEGRQRFTIGHEILHTFFPGFETLRLSRTDRQTGIFDRSQAEEYLCDVGAAELLFPRRDVLAQMPNDLTVPEIMKRAEMFGATIEATGRRFVELSERPAALVVLEPGWTSAEERELDRRRFTTGMLSIQPPIPKRLRVKWAVTAKGMPKIHRNKSVDLDTELGDILARNAVDYVGRTGLVPTTTAVSARHMPVTVAGRCRDRVVVLLSV